MAELEPLLVGKRLRQGLAQGVGVERRLVAVLQLRENHLQITNTSLHTTHYVGYTVLQLRENHLQITNTSLQTTHYVGYTVLQLRENHLQITNTSLQTTHYVGYITVTRQQTCENHLQITNTSLQTTHYVGYITTIDSKHVKITCKSQTPHYRPCIM